MDHCNSYKEAGPAGDMQQSQGSSSSAKGTCESPNSKDGTCTAPWNAAEAAKGQKDGMKPGISDRTTAKPLANTKPKPSRKLR
jgi:hypothetical protein